MDDKDKGSLTGLVEPFNTFGEVPLARFGHTMT